MATRFDPLNGYITDTRGSRYLLLRDIERCPYVPKDPEYAYWNQKDEERIKQIVEARQAMHMKAKQYLSHPDNFVRSFALFIDETFGD